MLDGLIIDRNVRTREAAFSHANVPSLFVFSLFHPPQQILRGNAIIHAAVDLRYGTRTDFCSLTEKVVQWNPWLQKEMGTNHRENQVLEAASRALASFVD